MAKQALTRETLRAKALFTSRYEGVEKYILRPVHRSYPEPGLAGGAPSIQHYALEWAGQSTWHRHEKDIPLDVELGNALAAVWTTRKTPYSTIFAGVRTLSSIWKMLTGEDLSSEVKTAKHQQLQEEQARQNKNFLTVMLNSAQTLLAQMNANFTSLNTVDAPDQVVIQCLHQELKNVIPVLEGTIAGRPSEYRRRSDETMPAFLERLQTLRSGAK